MRLTNQRSLQSASDGEFLEGPLNRTIREAEEGLMLAVLEDAIESFRTHVFSEDKKGKQRFQEAEEWILETNSDWLFSFEIICEVLGLDHNYLRQGLLRWKEAKRKPRPEVRSYSPAAGKKTKKSTSSNARTALVAPR